MCGWKICVICCISYFASLSHSLHCYVLLPGLYNLNVTVQVAAILDPVALSDGVAGMSNLLQNLNNTVQAAAILDSVAFNDGVTGMSNLLQHLTLLYRQRLSWIL